jgi:hypothetical protein
MTLVNSVDTRRNLLNRLKEYLKRFWEYYESSLVLKGTLESKRVL